MRTKFNPAMSYTFASLAAFPNPGEAGFLYRALDTGFVYLCEGDGDVYSPIGGGGGAGGQITAHVPDYANMETTNRITANNGTWTADRDGYVRVTIQTTVGGSACCEINGKRVGREYSGNFTGAQAYLMDVYPVRAGDVVKLFVDGGGAIGIECNFIPLKSVAAPGAVSGLMMGPPDYASMETTNRITANNGTWTADRNGYVRVTIQTTVGGSALCEIDGKRVGREYSGTNANAQACLTDVYPVGVGDVVKLWVDTSPASDVACHFIPPVLSVGSSGGANSLAAMGPPDYSAFTQPADLQAPISPNTLLWTADADCYVDALFDATGLTDSVYIGVEPPGKAKKNIFVGANHQAGERFVYQLQVTEGTKLYTDGGLTARLSRVMLHKIPPLYAAGRANSLLTMGPPNYSAIETTNRITTEGGTWTVDRDGYVAVLIQNLTAGYSAICAINGKWVGRAFSGVGTGAAGDVQAMHTGVHQVCKGDVVKLLVDDGTANTNMYCYYIPPVINPPLYVTGMPILSYSTAEQDTGIKWYNGKTIYQKSFTGTVSLPANSNVTVISLPGAEDFVDGWGIISRSPSSGIKIPGRSLDSSEAATHFMSDITITNGNIYCTARSDVAINPAGYLVTFQYTK